MCMTAVVAASWMDLCRSLTDSPSRLLPTKFGYRMCRLQKPFAAQRSMPMRQNPTLLSAQRRGQYQYPKDCSTLLRHTAKPSPLRPHCSSPGLLEVTKCCRASTLDRESRIRHHQYLASDQIRHGYNQPGIRFQRESFAAMQAHFLLLLVLCSYSLM